MLALLHNPRYVLAGVGLVAVIATGWWLHHTGYTSGVKETTERYESRIEEERRRLEEANRLALDEAQRRLSLLLEAIRSRNEQIETLQKEAQDDPSANDGALSPDSVRRINRVR
jgi:hypothetical protein